MEVENQNIYNKNEEVKEQYEAELGNYIYYYF